MRAVLADIELLFGSVLKVGFYIMKWNVIYKCTCACVRVCACVCVRACVRACVRVCVLNFYFAYLSLRHRTIFYIGTLLILMACVCVCVCVCVCACVCVWRGRARSCRCEYVRLGVVLLVQMGC